MRFQATVLANFEVGGGVTAFTQARVAPFESGHRIARRNLLLKSHFWPDEYLMV